MMCEHEMYQDDCGECRAEPLMTDFWPGVAFGALSFALLTGATWAICALAGGPL